MSLEKRHAIVNKEINNSSLNHFNKVIYCLSPVDRQFTKKIITKIQIFDQYSYSINNNNISNTCGQNL